MNVQLVLSLIGGAGFLAGIAGLLTFFNTRKATRDKSSADAYQAWRTFMTSAVDDAVKVNTGLVAERDKLHVVRSFLIDIVQEALTLARNKGATPDEIEPYLDRLDEVRAM